MEPITVDIEDYYSLTVRDKLGIDLQVSGYVDQETLRLLDFFDDLSVKVTCFVVGKLAKERPHLIKEVAARGHEIASHSFHHKRIYELSPQAFGEDLYASVQVLESITGNAVRGFRAPAFSLGVHQKWAFEIMAEQGIRYDSSVRISWPFGRRAGEILIEAAEAYGLQELPGFTLGWGPCRFPLAGGGGLRILPEFITRWGVTRLQGEGFLVPVYVHPYDLSTEGVVEKWPSVGWTKRMRLALFNWLQRRGRGRVAPRLRRAVARCRAKEAVSLGSIRHD